MCRNLGITVTSNLSSTQHIDDIVVKAQQHANHIIRCFTSGDKNLLVRAFIMYVRSLVEYSTHMWL